MDETAKLGPSPVLLTRSGDPGNVTTSLHEELQALGEQLWRLDYLLRDAADRKRFGGSAEAVAKAGADERGYLLDLDRLLTRFRAVEGQLRQQRKSFH